MKTGWVVWSAVCVVLAATAGARGGLTHDGSPDPNKSDPPGTGFSSNGFNTFNIGLNADPVQFGDPDSPDVFKDYFESEMLTLAQVFEGAQTDVPQINETVYNLTDPAKADEFGFPDEKGAGEFWSAFTITLQVLRLFGLSSGTEDAILLDTASYAATQLSFETIDIDGASLGDAAALGHTISSVFDDGTGTTTLTILFDELDPLEPGEGFLLSYRISCVTPSCEASGFNMTETPTPVAAVIPAPGAALLGALGLGFVGGIRRRST